MFYEEIRWNSILFRNTEADKVRNISIGKPVLEAARPKSDNISEIMIPDFGFFAIWVLRWDFENMDLPKHCLHEKLPRLSGDLHNFKEIVSEYIFLMKIKP